LERRFEFQVSQRFPVLNKFRVIKVIQKYGFKLLKYYHDLGCKVQINSIKKKLEELSGTHFRLSNLDELFTTINSLFGEEEK